MAEDSGPNVSCGRCRRVRGGILGGPEAQNSPRESLPGDEMVTSVIAGRLLGMIVLETGNARLEICALSPTDRPSLLIGP
jgi:hypothetical protein